ncbi:MAG TPA: valine--tRNA ligase [Planctomycetaceae bacterium]|nr:valine--tRNA ligase [Planctomycetaceae bacterium]
MPTDLPKQYDPQAAQQQWYAFWEQRGYCDADPQPDRAATPPHAIMIPLPNVTGALHMGHALNGTLQDLVTRYRRMQGCEALWMPGTDHAGIATQAVVERRMLEEEGLTRHDVGREALVNRIWKWKDAYERRILSQLKQLGASCDWRRTRFTLDEVCSKAVRRMFFRFFKDSLIYRGKRLVNWDTYLQTAVADDEVFEEEVDGKFWTFRYPVVGSDEQIAFSTTRPETMLGDTAVCVHPSDPRYQHLIGRKVRIPLNGREIPIIADALLAKIEMGTGAVKVTPAHDPNDYACYQRHPEIGVINILNPDGTVNAACGNDSYVGRDRYEVRDLATEDMAALGYFDGSEDRKIPLKHSDRSKTPIEPYLSDQWFVKMDAEPFRLAQSAIDAVQDGRVRFFPSRYAKTYLDWLGEKRDWCISRQLWWGHRIPVWSLTFNLVENNPELREMVEKLGFDSQVLGKPGAKLIPKAQEDALSGQVVHGSGPDEVTLLFCVGDGNERVEQILEAAGFQQDPDVLDTWFSSALWPHATLGWPDLDHNPPLADNDPSQSTKPQAQSTKNEVLSYFYPTRVLITSRDIITLWVARMVLTGLYNMGDVPFHHVHVHPKMLDGFGQTMSKSKGNGVDPADLINKYGTDAVRFTIASFAGETQDVRLPISYECPHCETLIPQTLEQQKAIPAGGAKPRVKCPKCGQSSQYSSPWFDPDPGEPVARMVSERFEYGRNFCNKLWNACRFAILNLEGYTPGPIAAEDLKLEDRWILSRLSTIAEEITTTLDRYQFDAATRTLREFTWNEFCDWYLEMLKARLRDEAQRPAAQRMLVGVLDTLLRFLQPFTPFIAEELWQRLAEIAPERGLLAPEAAAESVMVASWPVLPVDWRDRPLERRFERLQETIVAVRNVRSIYNIAPGTQIKLYMRCAPDVARDMQDVSAQFDNLAKTLLAAAGADVERPPASASFALSEADGYIPLEGVIDRKAELARQRKEADKLRGFITGHEKKLANESFVAKAPPEVVQQARETLAGLKTQLQSVEDIIAQLSAG